jgi:hypothetical protein
MTAIATDVNSNLSSFITQLENGTSEFYPKKSKERQFMFPIDSNELSSQKYRRNVGIKNDDNTSGILDPFSIPQGLFFKQSNETGVVLPTDSDKALLKEFERNINIIRDNDTSIENMVNNNRISILEGFTERFISTILEENFEYGIASKAHVLVKEQMRINAGATKEWLNGIYVKNFHENNIRILIGILQVISRFREEELHPTGQTMALASLSHKEEVVQETAIRVFESWGGKDSLKTLENVSVSSSWVKEYLNEVISDLKLEYAC